MSNEETEAARICHEWVRRVWNDGEAEAIEELFAADGLAHGVGPEPLVGPGAFKSFQAALFGACPSVACTVEDTITEGDRVALRLRYTVCHPKANGDTTFETIAIARVAGGQIVEAWNVVDWLPPLAATGLVPADAVTQFLAPA